MTAEAQMVTWFSIFINVLNDVRNQIQIWRNLNFPSLE